MLGAYDLIYLLIGTLLRHVNKYFVFFYFPHIVWFKTKKTHITLACKGLTIGMSDRYLTSMEST